VLKRVSKKEKNYETMRARDGGNERAEGTVFYCVAVCVAVGVAVCVCVVCVCVCIDCSLSVCVCIEKYVYILSEIIVLPLLYVDLCS